MSSSLRSVTDPYSLKVRVLTSFSSLTLGLQSLPGKGPTDPRRGVPRTGVRGVERRYLPSSQVTVRPPKYPRSPSDRDGHPSSLNVPNPRTVPYVYVRTPGFRLCHTHLSCPTGCVTSPPSTSLNYLGSDPLRSLSRHGPQETVDKTQITSPRPKSRPSSGTSPHRDTGRVFTPGRRDYPVTSGCNPNLSSVPELIYDSLF